MYLACCWYLRATKNELLCFSSKCWLQILQPDIKFKLKLRLKIQILTNLQPIRNYASFDHTRDMDDERNRAYCRYNDVKRYNVSIRWTRTKSSEFCWPFAYHQPHISRHTLVRTHRCITKHVQRRVAIITVFSRRVRAYSVIECAPWPKAFYVKWEWTDTF